jgi:predicted DNA-binding protein (UPF0278 family)
MQDFCHALQDPSTPFILPIQILTNLQIRKDLALLKEVIHTHNRVIQHEETLRQLQHIFHIPPRLRLEVLDTVIADIANCAANKWWNIETWDCRYAVL